EHGANSRHTQRVFDVVPSGVDVVIAGYHVDAEWSVERADGAGVDGDVLGAVIDQVAGDRDEIRRERARRRDDAVDESLRRVRSDVQIRQLCDAKSIEALGKSGDVDVHVTHDETPRAEISGDKNGGDDDRDDARQR